MFSLSAVTEEELVLVFVSDLSIFFSFKCGTWWTCTWVALTMSSLKQYMNCLQLKTKNH